MEETIENRLDKLELLYKQQSKSLALIKDDIHKRLDQQEETLYSAIPDLFGCIAKLEERLSPTEDKPMQDVEIHSDKDEFTLEELIEVVNSRVASPNPYTENGMIDVLIEAEIFDSVHREPTIWAFSLGIVRVDPSTKHCLFHRSTFGYLNLGGNNG